MIYNRIFYNHIENRSSRIQRIPVQTSCGFTRDPHVIAVQTCSATLRLAASSVQSPHHVTDYFIGVRPARTNDIITCSRGIIIYHHANTMRFVRTRQNKRAYYDKLSGSSCRVVVAWNNIVNATCPLFSAAAATATSSARIIILYYYRVITILPSSLHLSNTYNMCV